MADNAPLNVCMRISANFLSTLLTTEINNLKNDFKQYWYKRNDSPSATGGLQNFFILDS